jgi:hypothetical protein
MDEGAEMLFANIAPSPGTVVTLKDNGDKLQLFLQ